MLFCFFAGAALSGILHVQRALSFVTYGQIDQFPQQIGDGMILRYFWDFTL